MVIKQWPRVSVIIPFYSGVKWLFEAVESALMQDYPEKEIIVVNDGSVEALATFRNMYESRVVIIDQENRGPAAARNAGINFATGKYIALLDADDLWEPGKLSSQVDYMEKHEAVWCHHSFEMFWEGKNRTKIVDTSRYQGDVLKECFVSFKVQTACFMFRLSDLNKNHIRYPEEIRFGEDLVFYREMAKRWPLYHLDKVLAKLRIRGENAALQARVQLINRAEVWHSIKQDNEIKRILPPAAIVGFYLSSFGAYPVQKLNSSYLTEWLAKGLYVVPYLFFRLADKKLERVRYKA